MPGEPPGSSDPLDPDGLVGRAAEAAAIRRMLDGPPLVTVTRAASTCWSDQLRDRTCCSSWTLRAPRACAAAALLPPCPKMQVLATSREPLRVPGETTVAVRPLRLADAVELFGRRAAQAGTQIAPQHRAAVASICVQLDKLPLAIELAAAELGRTVERGRSRGAGRAARPAGGWRPDVPARRRLSTDGTGRCGPRSAGATSCAPRPSVCCGPGCRCSPARSAGGRDGRVRGDELPARGRAARVGLSDAPTRTHTSRPPLQDLYSLTNSEILNLTWWIRASWWIRAVYSAPNQPHSPNPPR